MYSGSTISSASGRLLGAHQRIDKIAHRQLQQLCPKNTFPSIKNILKFEGNNGPDAIKRKSPAKDEPWHFIDPHDHSDDNLIKQIELHYKNLVQALNQKDEIKSAFEAAWIAHAIVDGLTPAHHYPYDEKLSELRCGQSNDTRTSLYKKLVMQGETKTKTLKNNWKMWGPKGLYTNHANFETGVALLMAPISKLGTLPKPSAITKFKKQNLEQWYRQQSQAIAKLNIYDQFCESGWNIKVARKVRKQLIPDIIQAVTLVWYKAYLDSKQPKVLNS
ncbi:MAG: hypothetical protein EBX50_20525 [Chitinophagia bacterium]|nr:hypothetical protein [Chitinophagia bacterium]